MKTLQVDETSNKTRESVAVLGILFSVKEFPGLVISHYKGKGKQSQNYYRSTNKLYKHFYSFLINLFTLIKKITPKIILSFIRLVSVKFKLTQIYLMGIKKFYGIFPGIFIIHRLVLVNRKCNHFNQIPDKFIRKMQCKLITFRCNNLSVHDKRFIKLRYKCM